MSLPLSNWLAGDWTSTKSQPTRSVLLLVIRVRHFGDIVRLCVVAMLNRGSIDMILSKHCIPTININVTDIKNGIWRHFVGISCENTFLLNLI